MVDYVCSGEPRARAMQPTHELPGARTGAAVLGGLFTLTAIV